MILHLSTDSRFTDYTINQFSSESDVHVIGLRYPSQSFKYVKNTTKTRKYVFGWSNPYKVIKQIQPKVVVVHYLDVRWYELVTRLDEKVKVIWVFWGGDGYSLPKLKEDLLDPLTSRAVSDNLETKKDMVRKMKAELGVNTIFSISFLLSTVFETLRRIKRGRLQDERELLFSRVNVCATFLKEDYDFLLSKYSFNMNWIDARFISLDSLIGNIDEDIPTPGKNILIGNSSTIENNHIDCFEKLRSFELKGRKVICPLSYGKNLKDYRNKVVNHGQNVFRANFEPLLDLMPLKEYTEMLRSVGVAIMYHSRQQAFNNILALIFLGVKVYLKETNTIFMYLRRIGCNVYSVEELRCLEDLNPLDRDQIEVNRKIILEEFRQEKIIESVKNIQSMDLSE